MEPQCYDGELLETVHDCDEKEAAVPGFQQAGCDGSSEETWRGKETLWSHPQNLWRFQGNSEV